MYKIGQLIEVKEKAYEKAVVRCLKTKKKFTLEVSDYNQLFLDMESTLILLGSGIISRGWDDSKSRTILTIEFKLNQAVSMEEFESQLRRIR